MTIDESEKPFRWLHISDFHLKSGAAYDQDVVTKALVSSIAGLVERDGNIDFIFVTGDVANHGKKEEYLVATNLFDKILSAAKLDKNRLFIVPGNHDVDRAAALGLSRTLHDAEESGKYFDLENEIIHVTKKQSNFSNWYNNYFDGIRKFCLNSTCQIFPLELENGIKIEIVLANSAAFALNDEDHGSLVLGERCLNGVLDTEIDRDVTRIMLMHHPIAWLNGIEKTNIKSSVQKFVDIILTGHLHENDVEQIAGVSGQLIHFSAGASYQGGKWPNTAMICTAGSKTIRVLPISYSSTPRHEWVVDSTLFSNSPDFSKTFTYKCDEKADIGINTVNQDKKDHNLEQNEKETNLNARIASLSRDWQDQLFVSPSGSALYAEPRLMLKPQDTADNSQGSEDKYSIEKVIKDDRSYLIETKPEYGGTNLFRRLGFEIAARGGAVIVRDARKIPNYRKKLLSEFGEDLPSDEIFSLVLDNFDPDKDDKLLREIHSLGIFSRIIAISVHRGVSPIGFGDVTSLPYDFTRLYLWPMSRENIREMATSLFDSGDDIYVSKVVDKVYTDLLGLCIPLTPANVVMYLRVLHKEGDFIPINRVDILGRYLSESLRRPSDNYGGNFNYKNKLDVLSAFSFYLFKSENETFTDKIWFEFCEKYQIDTLSEFDPSEFLSELVDVRICARYGGLIFLRYSFYYAFLLGRHLSAHHSLMIEFIENRDHLSIPGVVDVITGLSSDNSKIVEVLTVELNSYLEEFSEKYVKSDFDPLLTALWPDDDQEEEKLWSPVKNAIAKGPQSVDEIDELKSMMLAEARTADQQVKFRKFTELEHTLFVVNNILIDALKNSDDVRGSVKLEAYEAILHAELVVLQVGTMFATELAKQKYFSWGGLLFIDFNMAARKLDPNSIEVIVNVITSLSNAILRKIADDIATHKLSGVFKARAQQAGSVGFIEVMNFRCVLQSRGKDWPLVAEGIIGRVGRNAFYLHTILVILMDNLEFDLMQNKDREATKRLVALVQAKRGHNKMQPGAKLVSRVLNRLNDGTTFNFDKDGDR